MSSHVEAAVLKWGIPRQFILGFSLFLLILCLPNVSNKYNNDTSLDELYARQKVEMVSVALVERCFSS